MLGGLVVSVAATTIDPSKGDSSEMSMQQMTKNLKDKSGDEYDKAFIEYMISHHESAVDMAKLSTSRAKHEEIKKLSSDIVAAQEHEISHMKEWRTDWNYPVTNMKMGH